MKLKILDNTRDFGWRISQLLALQKFLLECQKEIAAAVHLVGDSASNVFAGHSTTLPITIEEMIYHAKSVCRYCSGEGRQQAG